VVTIPASVWRGGFLRRALTIGAGMGVCLGAVAWLDSGVALVGVIVLLVVGVFYGLWMSRRMARLWPGAAKLTSDERVRVVRAARRGEDIEDGCLAPSVGDYVRGLHAAAEAARPWRWLLGFVLVVAVATAAWDAVFGTWGSAIASAVYLIALVLELFWWPKRQAMLLARADRAATRTGSVRTEDI